MINSLQILRGVFAIVIFLHHSRLSLPGGDAGVVFFLMLSGFLLNLGYRSQLLDGNFSYKDFIVKRAKNVYPIHWICLVVCVLAVGYLHNYSALRNLIPQIFLLQSWIPIRDIYFGGNAVSWFLSDILFCYCLFPFIFLALRKYTKLFIGVFVVILCVYLQVVLSLPQNLVDPFLYILPLTRLIDFTLGIILSEVFIMLKSKFGQAANTPTHMYACMVQILSILLVVFQFVIYSEIEYRFTCASYWWFSIGFMILVFSMSDRQGLMAYLNRVPLGFKSLMYLGKISLYIYLIHTTIISLTRDGFNVLGISGENRIMVAVVAFILTIIAARFLSTIDLKLVRR